MLIMCRTIHGMVYNAMKLFMEINPALFDECSHEYNQMQEGAAERQQERNNTWKHLEDLAKANKSSNGHTSKSRTAASAVPQNVGKAGSMRIDENNEARLETLKLDDGSKALGERRPSQRERQNSSGSSRSQR
jgi:serine/threonine-protein phosphatase 2A regulatory subunit B'